MGFELRAGVSIQEAARLLQANCDRDGVPASVGLQFHPSRNIHVLIVDTNEPDQFSDEFMGYRLVTRTGWLDNP